MAYNNLQKTYSGERFSFYQLFSTENLRVEIPIIQRDYAQGRDSEKEVRQSFVDALHSYLQKGIPFKDLDFVYGSILRNSENEAEKDEGNIRSRFVPLDGQQRLTTLFLLHWYLAQISGNSDSLRGALAVNGRSQFTYETRDSSREFCDALITHDIDFNQLLKVDVEIESVAATIKNRSWFFLSWQDDPTIRAMLTMIDAIHAKFKASPEFYYKLVDSEAPVITFRFLDLKEFKLTDDLYIKMNARGKPLTEFENFKAQFEKHIKQYKNASLEFRLVYSDLPVSGYDYFIHKIDTDWTDLFWAYRNFLTADDTFDDELMNFISLVIANHEILRNDLDSVISSRSRERLFGPSGKLVKLSFNDYETQGCLSQELLIDLIKLFDIVCNGKTKEKLNSYLTENSYYSEESTFKKVIANTTTYPEKLRFYAFYKALSKGLRGDELISWMRVVFNLTENRIFNTAEEYHNALKSIRDLLKHEDSIHTLLQQDISITGFVEVQVVEEKIKSHLFEKSVEWKNVIINAENHPFFKGQIGFLLKFSGIVDYYTLHGNTDWIESDHSFLESFKKYADSATAVFNVIAESSKTINFAWERSVLSKGNYLIAATANRLNLLSSRSNKNNIERDHSWKRLLRLSLNQKDSWNEKQSFVKAVFDDSLFDSKSIDTSLELICNRALQTINPEDWRWLLISSPSLIEYCQQGFIVRNSSETILLSESQRNHYHSELYSRYLYTRLKSSLDSTSPNKPKYESCKSTDEQTFVEFNSLNYKDREYSIGVWYKSKIYSVLFYADDNNFCDLAIESVLNKYSFNRLGECDAERIANLSHYSNSYIANYGDAETTLKNVIQLLEEFQRLSEK